MRRRYTRDELLKFLRGLDRSADRTARHRRGAAALRYGATRATKDIDTQSNVPPAVLKAADVARAATGLDVPIERAALADAPYFYEDRIRPAPLRLKKLRGDGARAARPGPPEGRARRPPRRRRHHLDPVLLWDLRRNLDPQRLPAEGTVVMLWFRGHPRKKSRYWLKVARPESSSVSRTRAWRWS